MNVKSALIIGGAIIVAVALWLYFSPYQSCVRADMKGNSASDAKEHAQMICAMRAANSNWDTTGIRNRFAHPLAPVTFSSPVIEAECLKLAHVPFYIMALMQAQPKPFQPTGVSGPLEAGLTALDVYAGACIAIYTGLLGTRIIAASEGLKLAEQGAPYPWGSGDDTDIAG